MSASILLVFLLGLLLIVLLIILYRIMYKNNMNKALEGNATQGLMDIGQLVKAIVFISLIILNIVTLSKVNNLEYQLLNVQNNMTSNINSIRYEMYDLETKMEQYFESQALIQTFEYLITDIEGDNYEYTFTFALSTKEVDADVYLVLYDQDDVVQKIAVDSVDLTYITSVVLERESIYEVKILIEGSTTILEGTETIDVTQDAANIVQASMFPDHNEDTDEEYLTVQVVNNFIKNHEKRIDHIDFKAYDEGELLQTITETSPLSSSETPKWLSQNIDIEVFQVQFDGTMIDWHDFSVECTITFNDGSSITLTTYL